jgi:hypothetical protein
LFECGHLDWITDVNHCNPIEFWHIDFLWYRQDWFISDTKKLAERIQQIVLQEMEIVKKNDDWFLMAFLLDYIVGKERYHLL